MSSTLKNILEKYKARSEDEQHFMDKHTDNVAMHDAVGKSEHDDAVSKIKKHSRSKTRQGYEPGEDEEVYESFTLEDVRAALSAAEINESVIDEVEDTLTNASPSYFMKIIDEAINEFYDEASEEEQNLLDEMLSTDEGYEELIDFIFEEKCEECGCEECECDDEDEEDDDDEIVDTKPKMKESK